MQSNVTIAAQAPTAKRGGHRQLFMLGGMLLLYMLGAAVYIVMPGGTLDPRSAEAAGMAPQPVTMPVWQLILANVLLILVAYGLLSLAGYWLSRKAGLPGIYREGAGWRNWFLRPAGLGAVAGLIVMAGDLLAQRLTGYAGFPHPVFPASIMASLTAGIGEEILTRLVVLSLWALILTWLAGRVFPSAGTRRMALWIANLIAALAFAATHLPGAMILAGVTTPAALPPAMLAELIVLNTAIGLLAGEAYIRDGLVAASGVHFWCDIVWHVIYGVLK